MYQDRNFEAYYVYLYGGLRKSCVCFYRKKNCISIHLSNYYYLLLVQGFKEKLTGV